MVKNTSQYENLFPTLLMEYDLRDFYHKSTLKQTLLDSIEGINPIQGNHRNFPYSWSSYNYDRDCLKPFPDLKKEIMNCINHYAKTAGFKQQNYRESWFNIYKEGGEATPHVHYRCQVSATFYPILDEGSVGLTLWRTLHENLKPVDQFSSAMETETPYTIENREIPIKEGHMYVWPSWTKHSTGINESQERWMIGINTNDTVEEIAPITRTINIKDLKIRR